MFEFPARPEWMLAAACRTIDPPDVDRFFPTSGGSVAAAREYCEGCTVRAECGAYAIEHRVHHGVWGGMSERDRRRARVERSANRAAGSDVGRRAS
jgi:WhiB family redox-sensing transcriptional regulator